MVFFLVVLTGARLGVAREVWGGARDTLGVSLARDVSACQRTLVQVPCSWTNSPPMTEEAMHAPLV